MLIIKWEIAVQKGQKAFTEWPQSIGKEKDYINQSPRSEAGDGMAGECTTIVTILKKKKKKSPTSEY